MLALAFGLLFGGGGCRADGGSETYYVRLISVDHHDGPQVPEERAHAILRRSLESAASFEPAERDQRSGRTGTILAATLEYRELPNRLHGPPGLISDDRGRDLLVRLAIETPRDLADELGPTGLDATVLLERESGDRDLEDDLQLAADRLALIVQARTDLARGTPGTISTLLDGLDPQLIALALEWVGDHPDDGEARAALDRTLVLINHADEDVRLFAIEALGAIGGPEHAGILLERIELNDPGQVDRAFDALSRLGGPEARRFLEFAAANEEEPDRRDAAEQALQRVEGEGGSLIERVRGRGHR